MTGHRTNPCGMVRLSMRIPHSADVILLAAWQNLILLMPSFQELGYRFHCFRPQRRKQVRQFLQRIEFLRVYSSLPQGKDDCLCSVACPELNACLMKTNFHSAGGYKQLFGDFLVSKPSGNENKHLTLSLCQCRFLWSLHDTLVACSPILAYLYGKHQLTPKRAIAQQVRIILE